MAAISNIVVASGKSQYRYRPLEGPSYTRVLSLEPGDLEGPIRCSLRHVDLDCQCPPYVALSYAWGDATDVVPIHCEGQLVHVTRNLHYALMRLRAHQPWRTAWVDALSINQSDDPNGLQERAQQVQMMGKIFLQAVEVVISFGDEDEQTCSLLKLIDAVAKFCSTVNPAISPSSYPLQENGVPSLSSRQWLAWNKFLERLWFGRIWMVQEYALAREASALIGNQVRPMNILDNVWRIRQNLEMMSGSQPTSRETQLVGRQIRNTLAYQTLIAIREFYRAGHRKNVAEMMAICSSFQATDCRDRIYALFGLADLGHIRLKIDYTESANDLAERFVRTLAKAGHSSLIFYLVRGANPQKPSWAPDLTATGLMPNGRNGFFPLRRDPHLFHASALMPATMDFSTADNGSALLTVKGLICATISHCTDVLHMAQRGSNSEEPVNAGPTMIEWYLDTKVFVQLLTSHYPGSKVLEVFWRTLISDITPSCQRASANFARHASAFDQIVTMTNSEAETLNEQKRAQLFNEQAPFLMAVGMGMSERRLCTTEDGRIASVPAAAETGDKIVVIGGSNLPIVLRRQGEYFGIIGNAYMYGIMDGEAFGRDDCVVEKLVLV